MLSLQSFLREGRVVGPCWEKLKPKGPKVPVSAYGGSLKNLKDLKDLHHPFSPLTLPWCRWGQS